MDKSRIVIAGGGIAGHKLAHALQGEAHVTLVDPKPFMEIPMAVPRLFVAPRTLAALMPYADFLRGAARVEGMLSTVAADHVTARRNDGTTQVLPFDFLVLSTGANYRSDLVKPTAFTTVEQRWAHFENVGRQIATAKRILIVGGGAIGVELTGEIVDSFPDKHVTLVEAGSVLLPKTAAKAQRLAEEFLRKSGVRVILGESVRGKPPQGDVDAQGGSLTTDKGSTIEYDLSLWCLGTRPDASYMREHFADRLNESGEIKVEPTLQVKGLRNVFALGDVADFPDKGAIWANFQTPVALKNLRALIKDGAVAQLKNYKRGMPATTMIATLGSKHGVAALPFGVISWGWLVRKMKADKMLVPGIRKGVGMRP